MSWQIIVMVVLSGFLILIPLLSYLSSRRMVGKMVAHDRFDADYMLYFYSKSCGPCRSMTPIIDQLSREHDNVNKIDITQDPEIAHEYGIRAIPTTVLVKEHVIKQVLLGVKSQKKLKQLLAEISS